MQSITQKEFASEFLIYKKLNRGEGPAAYLAMKQSSEGAPFPVVLKETDEKRAEIYQALCGMWNPYLADTYEVLQVEDPDVHGQIQYFAVTEYVLARGNPEEESLSLTHFIRKNDPVGEKTALQIGVQLCEGLKQFHKNGFVHRDLKPDNIMLSKYDPENPQIKIIDFGGAKWNGPRRHADTTVIGTIGYQAPESLSTRTTEQTDIYSIGCILNYMLTGQEPGLNSYRNNHYIANIIERATMEDPSNRQNDVTCLKKELEHELGLHLIDRIPILRALPGFRTHTPWKVIFSSLFYLTMIPIAVMFLIQDGTLWEGILGFFLPNVFLPLILIFNMGNFQRFFPEKLRRNTPLFFKIRLAIMLMAIFEPMIIYYTITNYSF